MRVRHGFLRFVVLCILAFLIQPRTAMAFKVSPQNQKIELDKTHNGELVIENERPLPLTLEFSVVRRSVNEDGSEGRVDESENFVIFPPQVLIPVDGKQKVRIQYVGPMDINETRSYHVIAEEVMVDFSEEPVDGIRAKLSFGASLHIIPPGARHDISVRSVEQSGQNARVTIVNNGNSFGYLDNARITLSSAGVERVYEGVELVQLAGRTLLTPGVVRTISLPLPEGGAGGVRATIDMLDD